MSHARANLEDAMSDSGSYPNLTGNWRYGGGNGDCAMKQQGGDLRIAMTWKPRHHAGDRPLAPHYEVVARIRGDGVGGFVFEGTWASNYANGGAMEGTIRSDSEVVIGDVTNEGQERLSGTVLTR